MHSYMYYENVTSKFKIERFSLFTILWTTMILSFIVFVTSKKFIIFIHCM